MISENLVLTLAEHKRLGLLLIPYIIDSNEKNGFFPILGRVSTNNISDFESGLSDIEKQIIILLEECSDKQLFKIFYKNKNFKNTTEFIEKVPDEYISANIRPYLDKRITKCIALLFDLKRQGLSSPAIYFKNSNTTIYKTDEIQLMENPAEVVFNFIKTSDDLTYFLSIRHNNTEIRLCNKKGIILTNEPCSLILENKIYYFRSTEGNPIDGKKIIPFLSKEFIRIPKSAEKKYFETFILNSIRDYSAKAEGFEITESFPRGKSILSFEKNFKNEPVFILNFQYRNDAVFFPDEKANSLVKMNVNKDNHSFTKLHRNTEWEKQEISKLIHAGLITNDSNNYSIPDMESNINNQFYEYINWLNRNKQMLSDSGFEVIQKFEVRYCINEINLDITAENNNDWFDIRAYVTIGIFRIPFILFRNHILNGIREYILPNNEIAVLPSEWFEKYKDLLAFAEEDPEFIKLKKHHFAIVNESVYNNQTDFKYKLNDLLSLIKKTKDKNITIPDELNAELRKYQKEGFAWLYNLYKHKFGGCLADDMGLGKTLQAICLLLKIKRATNPSDQYVSASIQKPTQLSLFDDIIFFNSLDHSIRTNLIILPTSLVHNWENEINKFAPSLQTLKYTGINREFKDFKNFDVILTTYGVVRNDIEKFKNFSFNYAILDESQYIKNPDSKIYQAVLEINATHKLVLTGTPLENSLSDLWSQINFLNPGMLGSLNYFKNEYLIPIEKNNDEEKQKKLKQLISPFILRRTKTEVAKDLPPLTEQIIYCDMTEEHREIYESEKARIRNAILENIGKVGIQKSAFVVLQGLTKLRQLANHPVLFDKEYEAESGKFEEIIRNTENLIHENHKVLIFSSFVKHLDLFADYFTKNNIGYSILTGKTPMADREKIIHDFQENNQQSVFLISLKAGGVGLNLISADYVFIADPWWNPASEDQAISRAHRIGQDKNVFAYKFISKNTIEEKIHNLQKRKTQLADMFVNSNNPMKNIEVRSLMELFY